MLLTVSAHDDDIGDDNDFVFGIVGAGLGSKYFHMVTPGSRKRSSHNDVAYLKLKKQLDFQNDKDFLFTIKVYIFFLRVQFFTGYKVSPFMHALVSL